MYTTIYTTPNSYKLISMRTLLTFISLSFTLMVYSQEPISSPDVEQYDTHRISSFSAGLELQTKYLWRGIEYGTAPTLFPSISYSTGGLYVYAMGGYAWNGSHQEVDFGISYTFSGISLGINDYYYPTEVGDTDHYFNYKGRSTGHWFEAALTYTPEKIPVWATVSTYFAGADKNPTNGKQAWSSYMEIGGQYDFKEEMNLSLAIGAALNKSFYNDYEHGFSVCNIALKYTKTFHYGYFTIPLGTTFVVNPYKNKIFLSFNAGISF